MKQEQILTLLERMGIHHPVDSLRRFQNEEDEAAFFCMTEADKAFAVDYYEKLVGPKGIPYEQYIKSFRLFLFYEYCEWVYVGNKYNDTSMPRYRSYFAKAKALAAELGF